jgi:predicted unusual protein kinase regulating ubiquinone biosynthesis (AarF/ABC1/UbiB family)
VRRAARTRTKTNDDDTDDVGVREVSPVALARRLGEMTAACARVARDAAVASTSSESGSKTAAAAAAYAGVSAALGALGPTYAKFGQALASRGDIVGEDAAAALGALQDGMETFSNEDAVRVVVEDLGEGPVADAVRRCDGPAAAASLAQVYKATIDGKTVAIKVQRPGIEDMVRADAALLRLGASAIEATGKVKARAVDAVDEFTSRIFEEMDFRREAENLRTFSALYGKGGSVADTLPGEIVVPRLMDEYGVGKRVIVMEWIDGEKLTSGANRSVSAEDLRYVELGISCTLSQLIETGVMHADPHGGNILKLPDGALAYLDFGLVSTVPRRVRDGLIAAIALLIFSRDYAAVGRLFGELMLIPDEVLQDEEEMAALERAREDAANATLAFPEDGGVPDVRFDQLLGALLGLVPRFKFVLPPYFLNNARALGTLEGMAKSADPSFNILAVVYPYAMRRALANPDGSEVIRRVIRRLAGATTDDTTSTDSGLSVFNLLPMLNDIARLTGASRLKIALDALRHEEARILFRDCLLADFSRTLVAIRGKFSRIIKRTGSFSSPRRNTDDPSPDAIAPVAAAIA